MLRCVGCGGLAHAGLAHLHGDPTRPLCESCTKKVLAEREGKNGPEIEAHELEAAILIAAAEILDAA